MNEQPTLFPVENHGAYRVAAPLDVGLQAAESCAAKAESLAWDRDSATTWVIEYLREHGARSAEVVVSECPYKPHDDRAFGAIFGALSRRRMIVKAGTTTRTKGHGSAGATIWALA